MEYTFQQSNTQFEYEKQMNEEQNIIGFNKFELLDTEHLLKLYMSCKKCNQTKFILDKFCKFIKHHGDQVVIESILNLIEGKQRSLQQIRKEFCFFTKKKQLNQGLLVSLLKSKRFSVYLQYFMEYYVDEFIENGSLKNSDYHMICISFIKRCFTDNSLIDKIIKYKKKN
ncbi:hypothetical protein TTHERM_00304140 (macronuclear) [Tetrahymena thermophila SB210]|uniref:Uncharacterized protein n=1 Tax=Tetrahymena thermophila (strain SB210) TaxID=312017 RepID=I7M2L2_TETTS|nr:hypothetical protein TTHERM_00304140 [Tetrahymena thermophila SB210]EAS00746.1 hypothetical protein TTHERM_00304140 [Tetrahymena thermophila SB210]|eukprot:XP_001020991.1 hypothetical protein TTHERM_00304140 [Tetrahymena thermophila SB210]